MRHKTLIYQLVTAFLFIVSGCGGGGSSSGSNTTNTNASYAITGQMKTVAGLGLPGVTVFVSGASTATTTTDTNGNYKITGMAAGSYILTPVISGYTFSPASLSVMVGSADVSSINSTAAPSAPIGSANLSVNSIAIGPDGTLYAGISPFTEYSSASIKTFQSYSSVLVYKTATTSAGIHWQFLGKIAHVANVVRSKFIIDPASTSTATTIYAGINSAVFKSSDSGNSWSNLVTVGLLEDIDIDSSSIVYLATLSSNFKSSYFTNTNSIYWFPVNNGLPNGSTIYTLAIDPSNPSTLFAGGHNGSTGTGIYKSIDGAMNWTFTSSQLDFVENGNTYHRDISTIVVDPNNSNTIYAGAFNYGLWKSVDGGQNWSQLTDPSGYISKLVMDNNNPARLYLLSINGLYYSLDGGKTWTTNLTTASINSNVLDLAIDPTNADIIYALYSGGILKGTFNPSNNSIIWTSIT